MTNLQSVSQVIAAKLGAGESTAADAIADLFAVFVDSLEPGQIEPFIARLTAAQKIILMEIVRMSLSRTKQLADEPQRPVHPGTDSPLAG